MPQGKSEPLDTSELDIRLPVGEGGTAPQLFARLYAELRQAAQRELHRVGSMVTLSATTLLHEVYLDMHDREGLLFPDRARFLAYAARAMRGLIIDYARSRQTLKRGAAFEFTSLTTEIPEDVADAAQLQRVGDALEVLATVEPRLAQVVDLKYFCGFSLADIAEMWGMSRRTVQRDWDKARLFLHRSLEGADEDKKP